MVNGQLDESEKDIPQEMLSFVKERIKEYNLHDIFVMDIAQIKEGFKLIECNCFNGTGFYKHNIEKIIKAINHYFRGKFKSE